MRNFLAVDVGGTNIKYALMLEDGTIVEKGEVPTPKTSLEDYVETLGRLYDRYSNEGLCALVMSAPGKIDAERGYFYTGGALDYMYDVDLRAALKDRIPLPFAVINDAKAAACAELAQGSMKGVQTGLVLTLGTGIGGAVIVNGQVHNGHTGAAGELSWLPLRWIGPFDGSEGMWTDHGAASALVHSYESKAGLDRGSINGREFFVRCNEGDPLAAQALKEYCRVLIGGVYTLQYVLDAQKIAFGGGISSQPALIDGLRAAMDELFEQIPAISPASKPEICACAFFNDANLIGALDNYLLREKAQQRKE